MLATAFWYTYLLEFRGSSYAPEVETSRKRPHEALGEDVTTAEKRRMITMENGDKECQNGREGCKKSSLHESTMPATIPTEGRFHREGRRPLRMSNQEGFSINLNVSGSGKGSHSIDEFDENSGDFFIDAESEIFTRDTDEQEDGELQCKYSQIFVPYPSSLELLLFCL